MTNECPDANGTLYDPPEDGSQLPSEDGATLRLSLSPEQAENLRAVAQQLGLTPSLVAKRAIEMACSEVVTLDDNALEKAPYTDDTLLDVIEEYQARLDLLHSVEGVEPRTASADEP